MIQDKEVLSVIVQEQSAGKSFSDIGRTIGFSKDKAQKIARKAQLPTLPKLPQPDKLPKEITIEGDIMIVSDLHCLAIIPRLVENVAKTAQMLDIKQLAIVGDIFNMDAFSMYPALVAATALHRETQCAKIVLDYWFEMFDRIYMCRGNHDARAIHATNGQIDMNVITDLITDASNRERFTVTLRDRLWLKESSGKWLLSHQHEYSQNPLVVANKLAAKYQCNVVTMHQHHFAVGKSKHGDFIVADNPCLCDYRQIAYTALNTNSMPTWALGFSAMKDGYYLPFPDRLPVGIA